MQKYPFEVRPVSSYQTGYPGCNLESGAEAADEQVHPVKLALLALLVLGLSLGLIGCYLKVDVTPETPAPVSVCGGGGDGDARAEDTPAFASTTSWKVTPLL